MKLLITVLILFTLNSSWAEKEVSIGIASNFSGLSTVSFNPFSGYFKDGILLALEDNKASLKAKKLRINLVEFDYGSRDLEVIRQAKKASASSVIGVLGYNYSSHALIAAPIHVKEKVPMLSPSATASRLENFEKYVHMGAFSNDYMAKSLANLSILKLKKKNVLTITAVNCAYCLDMTQNFVKEIINLGASNVKQIEVIQEDKDFSYIVKQIKDLNYDLIFIPNQEITSARIINALLDAGIKKTIIGSDGWGNEGTEFFQILHKRKFDGYSVTHWHPQIKDKQSREFVNRYKAKFGRFPNDTSVLAYDSMGMIIKTILELKKMDRTSFEEALSKRKSYNGITGSFNYEKTHFPVKDLVILKVESGQFKVYGRISGVKK